MTPDEDDLIDGPEGELRPEPEFRPIGQPARKRGRRGLWVGLGLIVVAGVAGAGGWVFLNGWPFGGNDSQVPLIRAETSPVKVQPASPGGMEVPDQDKLVYNRMEPNGGAGDHETVERLLPPPETPMPKPMPLPAPLTEAQPGQAAPTTATPSAKASPPAAPSAPTSVAPEQAPVTSEALPNAQAAPPAPAASQTTPSVQEVLGTMRPPPPPAKTAPPVSVTPKIAAVPPTPPPPAAGDYKVQLAAVRAREDVDKEWSRLTRQHSDLLGDLKLSVMRVDLGPGKGVFYRLRAGPLPDEATAKALCDKLTARKVGCLVVRPAG